jgi:hypothetical protein
VAANEIETLVVRAVRDHLNESAPTEPRDRRTTGMRGGELSAVAFELGRQVLLF